MYRPMTIQSPQSMNASWSRPVCWSASISIRVCIESIHWCIVSSVSRVRIRPTREETRALLFEAAADVFAEYGVGGATVEEIASAAGFTRGDFYSNFATKDELVLAMLDDHVQRSI